MGKRLLLAREFLGIDHAQFGMRIGLSMTQIYRLENGSSRITQTVALALEHVYGISVDWLQTGKGEMFAASAGVAWTEEMRIAAPEIRPSKFDLYSLSNQIISPQSTSHRFG